MTVLLRENLIQLFDEVLHFVTLCYTVLNLTLFFTLTLCYTFLHCVTAAEFDPIVLRIEHCLFHLWAAW